MSRSSRPGGGSYITPIDASGVPLTTSKGPGVFTLTAGQTYYYVLGGSDAPFQSAQLTSSTASLVITSATVQDCNHQPNEVSNHSAVAGEWIGEVPTTAYVAVTGTGWSATNGVVASSGSALGGALWHIAESGARRTRIAVVVGATGGDVRFSGWGKG